MTGRLLAERCKRCDRRLYEVRNYGIRATYCALCDLGLPTLRDRHPVTHEPVRTLQDPGDWGALIAVLPIIILALIVLGAVVTAAQGG